MMLELWATFCTYLISVVFHELGHLHYLGRVIKQNVPLYLNLKEIVVGDNKHYKNLSKEQYQNMLLSGIFAGFIPLIIFYFIFDWGIILFITYLLGCDHDFKELKNSQRDKKQR